MEPENKDLEVSVNQEIRIQRIWYNERLIN